MKIFLYSLLSSSWGCPCESVQPQRHPRSLKVLATPGSESGDSDDDKIANWNSSKEQPQHVVVIGAGWGGLSSAYWLAKQQDSAVKITVVDAAPRVGGLVRDGYRSMTGERKAEAGQHGKTPWN